MNVAVLSGLVACALFVGMLTLLVQGHRWGHRRIAAGRGGGEDGGGALDDAVFALLGLLIAFTFSRAGQASLDRVRLVAFSAILSLSVYVILDLEYPRAGLVRIDSFDRVLLELRESMRE